MVNICNNDINLLFFLNAYSSESKIYSLTIDVIGTIRASLIRLGNCFNSDSDHFNPDFTTLVPAK